MHVASSFGLLVIAQSARALFGNTRRAAIACEVSLLEYLDEFVLSVALDGASVANTSGFPVIAFGCVRRRRVARQASEYILP